MTRSRATAKQAGTKWESAIRDYLRTKGWVHAERRARTGGKDQGDITGIPGVCIEAKNVNRFALASWVTQAREEAAHANAGTWSVWVKRDKFTSPAEGYVVMNGEQYVQLLKEAGY